MSDASNTIGNLGGLNDAQAWKLEALRWKARAEFAGQQCERAWAETRDEQAKRERAEAALADANYRLTIAEAKNARDGRTWP